MESAAKALKTLEGFDSVFGVLGGAGGGEKPPAEVEQLAKDRAEARKKKDFKTADDIRDKIRALGWTLEDTREGPKWKKLKS